MNPKEWAERLNGRECVFWEDITPAEKIEAEKDGVVVVFCTGDDLMEFHGAIEADFPICGGGTAFVTTDGLFKECGFDEHVRQECKVLSEARKKTCEIEAIWTPEYPEIKAAANGAEWLVSTDIPHVQFELMDEGKPFSRGVVFLLADATPKAEA